MTTFSETKSRLNRNQITGVEEFAGLNFPEEYITHLLQHNGGQCYPNVCSFRENGRRTESNVDWFLGIYDGEYDNLKTYIRVLKLEDKRVPNHILPIANDPGGNLICISCATKDQGYVYFWDHENEVDYTVSGDDDYSNLYLVAKSFTLFIEGLNEGTM